MGPMIKPQLKTVIVPFILLAITKRDKVSSFVYKIDLVPQERFLIPYIIEYTEEIPLRWSC